MDALVKPEHDKELMAEVTAILVTYNSAAVVAKALESLMGQPDIGSVMVVDNASGDGTRELIRGDFPNVELIENPKNEGFGRANNMALARVATPYALLVNPDAVVKEGALAALLAAAKNYPDAAILAPLLYDESGMLHRSYKRGIFAREKKRDDYVAPSGNACAEFLSGAVWVLNMRLMKDIGFFDPNIFLYYEDDDICLRVRERGYGLVLVHGAEAIHLQGASSGTPKPEAEFFKQKHMIWSRLYMEKKYRSVAAAKTLAVKLYFLYVLKAAGYGLLLNKKKIFRYRGRIAGIAAFNYNAETMPAA